MNSDDQFEIIEPWHEVPFELIGKRTQLGQAITLGVKHGWEVKAARTVVETKDRQLKNGKIKKGSIDEYFWIGGAKPGRVFLINKFYMMVNKKHCSFAELKQFILEN